jgi:hypothetical protein
MGLGACSGQAEAPPKTALPPGPAPHRESEVERFLPLKDDTVFTYAVWLPESVEPEQLILQVERRVPGRASLRSGNSVKRLEFVADGVRLVSGGYLLKAPLEPGAHWVGPAGRVHVTAMNREVTVAAGQFAGCLETTETGRDAAASRAIVTTYCPGIGIVKFSADDGERQERFELKAYGPHIRIDGVPQ